MATGSKTLWEKYLAPLAGLLIDTEQIQQHTKKLVISGKSLSLGG